MWRMHCKSQVKVFKHHWNSLDFIICSISGFGWLITPLQHHKHRTEHNTPAFLTCGLQCRRTTYYLCISKRVSDSACAALYKVFTFALGKMGIRPVWPLIVTTVKQRHLQNPKFYQQKIRVRRHLPHCWLTCDLWRTQCKTSAALST